MLKHQVIMFEETVKKGTCFDCNTLFSEYAEIWLENNKPPLLAPKGSGRSRWIICIYHQRTYQMENRYLPADIQWYETWWVYGTWMVRYWLWKQSNTYQEDKSVCPAYGNYYEIPEKRNFLSYRKCYPNLCLTWFVNISNIGWNSVVIYLTAGVILSQ